MADREDFATEVGQLIQEARDHVTGVPVFATRAAAQAWETENPGRFALTMQAPGAPTPVAAQPPVFNDAAGTYTIPDMPGVAYAVDGVSTPAGTYSAAPGTTLLITATPTAGYSLVGPASWQHLMPIPDPLPGVTTDWSAYQAAVLADAPVFYAPLSSTASLGTTTTPLTAVNAVFSPFAGTTAALLDGSGPGLTAARNAVGIGGAWTMEALIYDTDPASTGLVLEVGDMAQIMRVSAGKLNGIYNEDLHPTVGTYVTGGTVTASTLTHVAVTFDGTSLVAYVNGTGTTKAGNGALQAGPADLLTIGGRTWAYFTGYIMHVAAHNKALTAAQLRARATAAGISA